MKKRITVYSAAVLLFCICILNAQDAKQAAAPAATQKSSEPAKKPALTTQKEKASYAIGWTMGTNFKKQSLDVNIDLLCRGLKQAFSGANSLISDDEMKQALQTLQSDMQAKQTKERNESMGKNKKEGEDFLAKNKTKEGVKVTATGLQYRVIKEGKGEKPKPSDSVTVNYEGKLIDGTIFDSSYKRGQPATFGVSQVIPGWVEGLQMMAPGSKYEFFIPSDLAYGERGAQGGGIGPNEALIFTVELISINKEEKK